MGVRSVPAAAVSCISKKFGPQRDALSMLYHFLSSDPDTSTTLKIDNVLTLPTLWKHFQQNPADKISELCPWPELI